MKSKIYSKLFKFSDTRSWEKVSLSDNPDDNKYNSTYYNEYKLEFYNADLAWFYTVFSLYKKSPGYSTVETKLHEGIVTLNIVGKFLFTIGLTLLSYMVLLFCKIRLDYKFYAVIAIGCFILSNFILSIFNWTIFKTLNRVQYYYLNKNKIEEKEKEEILKKSVTNAINKKIASDPKLARRTKLKELNKKRKWFLINPNHETE